MIRILDCLLGEGLSLKQGLHCLNFTAARVLHVGVEMTDKEFLQWLHDRLVNVHNEHELFDYMHRLRAIIKSLPKDQRTRV